METTVYISTPLDFRTRFKNWWKRLQLKAAIQHIGLLIILMVYTAAGGMIFRSLEYPAELEKINNFNFTLTSRRLSLIQNMVNNRNYTSLDYALKDYEMLLNEAFSAGVSIFPQQQDIKWTMLRAIFFSSTVLTTIGYGNIVPVTTEGRIFCMAFALIGIPLTLTVIADWGRLFASTASSLVKKIPPLPSCLRSAMVIRRTSSYAFMAVCFLFIYLGLGAAVFVIWEDEWTFFDGFYFCFITMTTIGFGDLVPKHSTYMLLCTLYILVGLALTSTIIELVRRQYAHSWRQIRSLQGPLADHLRRIADNASGLDILGFQQDFLKVMTVVSMPRKGIGSSANKKDNKMKITQWEDAMEEVINDMISRSTSNDKKITPVVQFVVYESSV